MTKAPRSTLATAVAIPIAETDGKPTRPPRAALDVLVAEADAEDELELETARAPAAKGAGAPDMTG